MSLRNPQNDRYMADDAIKGTTRKSAASAKPKTAAASTVTVVKASSKSSKTSKSNKADAKKNKDAQKSEPISKVEERMFYDPPTEHYHSLRRAWAVSVACTIVFSVSALIYQGVYHGENEMVFTVLLGIAWLAIAFTVWLDLGPSKKERRRFQTVYERTMNKERREEQIALYQEYKRTHNWRNLWGLIKVKDKPEDKAKDEPSEEPKN